ncbi:MAG: glycosyltransferase family 2 protein [Bryobacterales bacterium]|nr:glycosyltransferase family 2 protein [Bryobacterales bacterium]
MISSFLATLLGLSLGIVVFVYVGYPLLLLVLTAGRRYRAPRDLSDEELPSVSFVVAAYNEEMVIEEKVRNCLAIDYPAGKLEFFFVSDSTDGTNDILRRYESSRIRVKILPERRGKLAAIGEIYPLCKRDVTVMSDANTYYYPDSVRKLVRHFSNPAIGAVTGDVRLLKSKQRFGEGEGLYYRYERKLQELESALWSTVAIDGGMYAVRRDLWRHTANSLVSDDFVTGMTVGRQGYRIIFDPEAVAEEDPTPTDDMEFRRKIRVIAYAVQSLVEREGLPRWHQGRFLLAYVSHKLLRWFAPVFLLLALVSAAALSFYSTVGRVLFAAQLLFYVLALAGWRFQQLESKIVRVPYYFSMVNLAALLGVIRGLRRRQKSTWVRTERSAVLTSRGPNAPA